MRVSELFKQDKVFTGIRCGTWLKRTKFVQSLVLISYIGRSEYVALCWELTGSPDQADQGYWYSNAVSFPYSKDKTFTKEEIIQLLGYHEDLEAWEILTNIEAAKILATLPTTSL